MAHTALAATWLVLLAAGVGGLGLGIGLVIGTALLAELRRSTGGDGKLGGHHRSD